MFILACILLIVLVAAAGMIIVQNFSELFTSIYLTLFSWHLPGIPVLVLFLLGVCIGGLLLYVVSSISAFGDAREIKKLRKRVNELRTRVDDLEEEKAQAAKTPSGPLNFPSSVPPGLQPPAIPFPAFAPGAPMNPTGPLGQRQPTNGLQNLPPSASGNNLSLPRQFPPLPQTGQQQPFPRQ